MNISSVAADTGTAAQELTTAAEYQRRAGRRAACLMLILAVVLAVVLLAVSGLALHPESKLTFPLPRFCHDATI